jgi:hypothetical protein
LRELNDKSFGSTDYVCCFERGLGKVVVLFEKIIDTLQGGK